MTGGRTQLKKGKAGILCLLLALLLLPLRATGEQKVFFPGETEPFPEGAELLTIRVGGFAGGDCMLLTMGEHSMFVDLGTDTCLPKIQELTAAAGIDRVEYFFNSHPHCDHIGGLIPLLESGFPVGAVMTFFDHHYLDESVLQIRALNCAKEHGVPILDMKTEDQIPFGAAELTAYRVPDNLIRQAMRTNDLSAMLLVRYGDCTALLTGDVEYRSQLVLPQVYRLKADILKIPHHGATEMKRPFLLAVDPEYVFVTHNSGETVRVQQQLKDYGLHRMNFAAWGIITMQTDGHKWIVSQEPYEYMTKNIKAHLKSNSWIDPGFVMPSGPSEEDRSPSATDSISGTPDTP